MIPSIPVIWLMSLYCTKMCCNELREEAMSEESVLTDGYKARLGQFPWEAEIFVFAKEQRHRCTGSLIHPNIVLTSAECVTDYEYVEVIMGHVESAITTKMGKTVLKNVNHISIHPDYVKAENSWNRTYYDIALIHLDTSVKLSPIIQPIEVYSDTSSTDDEYLKRTVTVLGWSHQEADVLLYAPLTVVPKEMCRKYYEQYSLNSTHFMCVTGRGQRMCVGDRGGPLFYINERRTAVLIGMVEFATAGNPCFDSEIPRGVLRVGLYASWIQDGSQVVTADDPLQRYNQLHQFSVTAGGHVPNNCDDARFKYVSVLVSACVLSVVIAVV